MSAESNAASATSNMPSTSVDDAVKPSTEKKETSEDATVTAPDTTTTTGQKADVPTKNTEDEAAVADTTMNDAEDTAGAAATPASSKKDKRKSTGGVPEHRSKKPTKKKSMVNLHLDVQPGEHYMANVKGYPPWPSVVCDEEMLPTTLLANRPVSAQRPDGTYREDFYEGGKNAKDRTYPVMFLSTNDFIWIKNYDLRPMDIETLKTTKDKKSKQLQGAYDVAIEGHDLEYYKKKLMDAEEERMALEQEAMRKQDEKAEKEREKERKKQEKSEASERRKSKSKSKAADNDVEMADGDEGEKKSKKRKKEGAADDDGKPVKSAKIKLSAKTNGESTPKSATKSKKKGTSKEEGSSKPAPKQLTEAEDLERREKEVFYIRHKLQKAFLSRDQAPKEEEMAEMSNIFEKLENYPKMEVLIIKKTKINKVLKGILKLSSIPKDEEFKFKERSNKMLKLWSPMLANADDAPSSDKPTEEKKDAPATNGVGKTEDEEKKPAASDAAAKDEDKVAAEPKSESAPATDAPKTETTTESAAPVASAA